MQLADATGEIDIHVDDAVAFVKDANAGDFMCTAHCIGHFKGTAELDVGVVLHLSMVGGSISRLFLKNSYFSTSIKSLALTTAAVLRVVRVIPLAVRVTRPLPA